MYPPVNYLGLQCTLLFLCAGGAADAAHALQIDRHKRNHLRLLLVPDALRLHIPSAALPPVPRPLLS